MVAAFAGNPIPFSNNAIVIIDCLRPRDWDTAGKLREHLEAKLASMTSGPKLCYERAADVGRFLHILDQIEQQCKLEGLRPILQIECHGDPVKGLALQDDQDTLPWAHLEGCLRRINVAAQGNLGVVTAACYGLHGITPIRIHKPTPFFFLVGPDEEIYPEPLLEEMKTFYDVLLRSNNLTEAFDTLTEFRHFLAAEMCYIAIARVFRKVGVGENKRRRIEDGISLARLISGDRSANSSRLQEWRLYFKDLLSDERLAERMSGHAETFLGHKAKANEILGPLFEWIRNMPADRTAAVKLHR